jgi:hypothetical protein
VASEAAFSGVLGVETLVESVGLYVRGGLEDSAGPP